jgi:hypothetical protein
VFALTRPGRKNYKSGCIIVAMKRLRFNAPMASGASGQVFLYGGQSALFGASRR